MNQATVEFYFILAAFVIDLVLGDPSGWPHPVRWIGSLARGLEDRARSLGWISKRAGALAVLAVVVATAVPVWLLINIPALGLVAWLYLAYAGLALGGLLKEGRSAAALLAQGHIEAARERIADLVSRDVSSLDREGLRRTLAESVSENLCDAFVAPFFYLCITGPVGLWVYKAVSTLDSMWGYKTERYEKFGWFAAKCDDVFAWLPARLAALLMLGAGLVLKLDVKGAYDNMLDDAGKSESPNAGWPMAVAAWLVGAPMGGTYVYFGQAKDKPRMGPEGSWTDERLQALIRLCLGTGIACAIVMNFYFFALL